MNSSPKRRGGIRTRLHLAAAAVAIGALAVSLIRARERQMAEQRRLGERAQDNAALAVRSLDGSIAQAKTLLETVSFVVDPEKSPEANDLLLQQVFAAMAPTYSNLYVVDTTGRNIGAAVTPVGGRKSVDLSNRAYFRDAMASGRFTVGMVVRSQTLAGAPWVLPFILPITESTNGRIRALVGGSILVDSLEAVRLVRTLPANSILTVLDSSGHVVIRTQDGDRWMTRPFPNYPREGGRLPLIGSDTVVPSSIDRTDRLFGSGDLTRAPWRAYVGIPAEEILAPSRRQFMQDLLLGFLASLGVLLIGYWITSRIVSPIESLTSDAQAISDGDMTRRSVVVADDEVGTLARTFNQMADAIVDRNSRLAASEQQLREAQKLEALGAFAGGIAHDFNNYLTSIVGHTQLALEATGSDDNLRLELESALTSAQRASELTKQILVFSRRQVVSPSNVDVNRAIRGMQRLLDRLLGEPISLHLALAPALGSVHIDQGQLEQVVVNLIVNARDAMPLGGECTVRTSRTRNDDGLFMVCIDIEDTGDGIPDSLRERIFEPFFTTKGRAYGTGLGLSISYGIITGAGGTITVGSSERGGARFSIQLPEGPPVAEAPAASVKVLPQGRAERVLIVDDDESVLLVSVRILLRAGYTVERASSAAEAMTHLHSSRFDLLVTDVVMPAESGPQLVRNAIATHGPMRVLFVSGYPDDDSMLQEIAAHQAEFLPKPFSQESLLQRVRNMLDKPIPAA